MPVLGAGIVVGLSVVVPPSCSSQLSTGIKRVWAVDETEKIAREDVTNAMAVTTSNAVWNGGEISLFGSRNEVVGFQLIVESTSQGARSVHVALDSLVGPGFVIANAQPRTGPTDYVGKRIELFRAHYVTITKRSTPGRVWSYGGKPSDYFLSSLPDALTPLEVGTARGGGPFDIAASNSQTVWVDVFVPKDALPGTYRGTLVVTEASRTAASLPVTLLVYNIVLSDSTHLKNMFFAHQREISQKHGVPYPGETYYRFEREYHKMAHRHRMDLVFPQSLEEVRTRQKGYFTGESYSKAYGYEGPGENTGNGTYGIGVYDQPEWGVISGFDPATEAGWRAASDAWVTWFETNAPRTKIFKYMNDEPDSNSYAVVRERASWLHNNPGPGRRLDAYCTTKIDPRLFGAVDFWGVTGISGYDPGDGILAGYVQSMVASRRALGEKFALYNGWRPAAGVLNVIDTYASDARVNPWICARYGIDQYFLWYVNRYTSGAGQIDIWNNNFYPIETTVAWGDGIVLYPGQDRHFPAYDRGIEGPIASHRMKNWRRGQQDFEYLWLARSLGVQAVDSILRAVVPVALDETPGGQNSAPVWAERGHMYEAARSRLARLIASTLTTVIPPMPESVDASGSVGPPVSVRVEWSPALGAAQYQVQVSKDSLFGSPVFDTTVVSLSVNRPNLPVGLTYFVRLRAGNTTGWSTYRMARGSLTSSKSGVDSEKPQGAGFQLDQNYPNPFNPVTTLAFTLSREARVDLRIFDVVGREMAALVKERLSAGVHRYEWNAGGLSSGVYIAILRSSGYAIARRLVLLK